LPWAAACVPLRHTLWEGIPLSEKREVIVVVEPDSGQRAALAELLNSSGYEAKLAIRRQRDFESCGNLR